MTTKVTVKAGGHKVVLQPHDYIASGGEGTIYRKGALIYKVFHPGRTGLNALEQKLVLLSAIKHPHIVSPMDCLYDLKDSLIGFTMPYTVGEVLVKYFNNEFRKKSKFGLKETTSLAYGIKEIVAAAHAHKALIVDGNEMNYLVNGEEPWIIDVDSWQIGNHKATAIMASVRDYQAKDFTTLTDWFSWGIVTFQLFTGIHPYKGKHPKYRPGDLVERMKANVSIFDKHVLLPSVVRDPKEIPGNLRNWYEATFQNGKREAPPDTFDLVQAPKIVQKTIYKSVGKLMFTKLREYGEVILQIFPNGTVVTGERVYTKSSRYGVELSRLFPMKMNNNYHCKPTDFGVILAKDGCKDFALIEGDSLTGMVPGMHSAGVPRYFSSEERLFQIVDAGIMEVNVVKLGSTVASVPVTTWNLNPGSTFFGDGAAVYDALGTPFMILPMGVTGCLITRQDELKDKSIIAVKGVDKFVTCLVKDRSGQNFKVELYYENQYTVKPWVGPTDETGLNFSVNHRGTVATIVDDGEMVLFSPKTGQTSKITDKHIKADMALCTVNDNIGFVKENEVWSIQTS